MKIIYSMSQYVAYVATAVLGLMMLLTVADVFLRFFFSKPITGTTEITEFMLIIIVFPLLAWCAVTKSHVKVDLLVSIFSPKVQLIIDTINLLVSLGILVIITYHSVLESLDVNTTTSYLSIPRAPFYWIMSFGLALFCLSIIGLIVENILKEVRR